MTATTIAGMLTPALVTVAFAMAVGLAWSPLVRSLPEPDPHIAGADSKIAYATLATTRHALVVAAAAGVAALVAAMAVPLPRLAPWLVLAGVGSMAGVVDAATTWIPRRLLHAAWLLVGLAVLTAGVAASDLGAVWRAAAGAAIGGGLFFVVHLVSRALGFADVRLGVIAGGVAAWTSWSTLGMGLLLGSVLGAAWGVVVAVRRGRDGSFAYGPSIVAGPFLALLVSLG